MDRQPRKILFNICCQRDQKMEHQKTKVSHNGKLPKSVSSTKLVLKSRTHGLKEKLDIHEKGLYNITARGEAII